MVNNLILEKWIALMVEKLCFLNWIEVKINK